MMILLIDHHDWQHSGYTKAVDWWSLGVTLYKMLLAKYPFRVDFSNDELNADDIKSRDRLEGSMRYAALCESVDYSDLEDNPTAVNFLSRLLTVEDTKRLGYGPSGANDVSSHPFFASIDWVKLEKKELKPPPLPASCLAPYYRRQSMSLEMFLTTHGKYDWYNPPANKYRNNNELYVEKDSLIQEQLLLWDYTSPACIFIDI